MVKYVYTIQNQKNKSKDTESTSFAVESGGRRKRVTTEVLESLKVTLESGGEVTIDEDRVATEPPVHRHSEPVPQLELQRPGLVLPQISTLNSRRRHDSLREPIREEEINYYSILFFRAEKTAFCSVY